MAIDPLASAYGTRQLPSASNPPSAPEVRVDQEPTRLAAPQEERPRDTANQGQPAKEAREKLDSLLEKMNIVMNAMDIQAHFSVHEATNRVMVKVVNVESGEVIREIPPKKILDAMSQMMELVGILVDERA